MGWEARATPGSGGVVQRTPYGVPGILKLTDATARLCSPRKCAFKPGSPVRADRSSRLFVFLDGKAEFIPDHGCRCRDQCDGILQGGEWVQL